MPVLRDFKQEDNFSYSATWPSGLSVEESLTLWKEHRRSLQQSDTGFSDIRSKPFGGRTEKIILKAKEEHRTDIKPRSWSQFNYHKSWKTLRSNLSNLDESNPDKLEDYPHPPIVPLNYSTTLRLQKLTKIYGPDYSLERFQKEFERQNLPCLIQGLCDNWLAREGWNYSRMREVYGEGKFKCGEDDDGNSIRVKLKHFLRYQSSSSDTSARFDDSPLYIFEPNFDNEEITKDLVHEYTVPHVFKEDLFQYIGEKRRPPYRWILFGPARSGSNIHIDPLATSAWNALLQGRKLWVLFPPSVDRNLIKARIFKVKKLEDDEPIDYFVNMLSRLLTAHPELQSKMIRFIQHPGETVFVPTNWWHAVLNLDDTIAVTQNYCSTGNFDGVWRKTRTGRTKMAQLWLSKLREVRPDLARRACELDAQDGFDLEARCRRIDEKRERKRLRKERQKAGEEVMSTSSSSLSDSTSSSSDDDE